MKFKTHKNYLAKILLMVYLLICATNITYANNVDCNSAPTWETPLLLKSETNPFSDTYRKYSDVLHIPDWKLEELLTIKKDENIFSLVPITDTLECKNHWTDMFVTAKPGYMCHYANGKLKTHSAALERFNTCYRRTWVLDNKKQSPRSMTFIIAFNGEFAGQITIGPLRDCAGIITEIGYVTLESFSGKGVTTAGVQLLINLLKYMKNENMYRFNKIRATANVNNPASNRILTKCGFRVGFKTIVEFGMRQNEYFLSI